MMVKCVFTHHLSGAIISAAPSHATDQTPLHYIKTGTSLENTTVGMAWEWHGRGLCLKVHWRNPSLKQTLKKPQDVDFVVPFFLGGGGRAKLVFCSPMILKKKVSKNMRKKKNLFFPPIHPKESPGAPLDALHQKRRLPPVGSPHRRLQNLPDLRVFQWR